MGVLRRKYSGTPSGIIGRVVKDGANGVCALATASDQPLGVAVDVSPNGMVDIAGPGDRAFVVSGGTVSVGAGGVYLGADSNSKAVAVDVTSLAAACWTVGQLINPIGDTAIAADEMIEIAVNPQYHYVYTAPESPTVEESTPEESTPAEGGGGGN